MFVVYQFRGLWQRTVVILRLPSRAPPQEGERVIHDVYGIIETRS